jgi:hypothetical protein
MRRTLLHLHMFYISGFFSLEIYFEKTQVNKNTCISRAISSSSKGQTRQHVLLDTDRYAITPRHVSSKCSS